ncbi:hypothetical protein LQW54_012317 [Pestalotiopsis sp. IQ-011]
MTRFGFFASLPDFNDIEGTLSEIQNIFGSDKRANGVVVMTSYGEKLAGDDAFRPIWDELNKYSALVFLHPSHVQITPEKIGGFFPQPVIDYPLATTRAAMSLLVSGIMTQCAGIDVILSHAGGAFPMLAQRGLGSLLSPAIAEQSKVNMLQAKSAADRFWYDLALSTSEAHLKALLATAPASNIVYGSDFLYAPKLGIYAGLLQYSNFTRSAEGSKIGPQQLNENATCLLQKHAPEHCFLPQAHGRALKQYGAWQEEESAQMMAEYVFKPEMWYKHHYRYANSVVHRIALGDRLVKLTKELSDLQNCVTFFVGSIGSSLVDWFPDVVKLPKFLHLWAPQWEKLGRWNYDVYQSWYEPARKQVEAGTAHPSFLRDTLLHPDTKYKGDDEDSMYVAMQLIEAGSDTTREALNIMVTASLEYPEPFRKARAEIDQVCGVDAEARLPRLEDMDSLRYICAMAKEILRWRPIFILTPDHTLSQDLEFEGFFFPAGVGFVINEVAVFRECEDPDDFKPERWMDGHETDIAHGLWQFGGGRRICVGYRLAQRSLFINIARLVQCIDFEAARLSGEYDSRLLNHDAIDEPFPVKPRVRSDQYKQLIIEEATRLGVLEDAKAVRDSKDSKPNMNFSHLIEKGHQSQ